MHQMSSNRRSFYLLNGIVIFLLIVLFYYIVFIGNNDFRQGFPRKEAAGIRENWYQQIACKEMSKEEQAAFFPPDWNKFVVSTEEGYCGRMANQLYRFAALYGIGKPLGRKPALFTAFFNQCEKDSQHEMGSLFPGYAANLAKVDYKDDLDMVKFREFTLKDTLFCKFDDPNKYNFTAVKQQYLVLGKHQLNYFQHFNYFHLYRDEIRRIFSFSPKYCARVERRAQSMFGLNIDRHKFCIHTRMGDFKQYGYESKKDFTEKAAEYVANELKKKYGTVSMILLGEDKDFLDSLHFGEIFEHRYMPQQGTPGEDFALAVLFCDSLLVTAPESTFSFWMAYMLPEHVPVYYYSEFQSKSCRDKGNFLPEWTPLKLVYGKIVVDK